MRALPQRFAAVTAVALLAVPALLPLLSAAAAWSLPAGEVWQHQLQHVLPRVAGNTALLLALVAAATALLGTGLAWLVAGHDFPGRGFFAWALLLPLAVPGYRPWSGRRRTRAPHPKRQAWRLICRET